jgi:hypothetical protein
MRLQRVVARYLQSKETQNFVKMEKLFEAVDEPLRKAVSMIFYSFVGKEDPSKGESLAPALAKASQEVIDALSFNFENPSIGERFEKLKGARLKNLKKMLSEYTKVKTWDKLQAVLNEQNTKAKNPWQKYIEYRDEALRLIGGLDSEVEGHMDVANYSVVMVTSTRGNWDNETIGAIQWVLRQVNSKLSSVGMSSVTGGKVFAYPTSTLPASAYSGANTLAYYNTSDGVMGLAVGREPEKALKSMIHELGHKAYYKVTSVEGRNAWRNFFESNSGAPNVDHIIKDWEAYTQHGDWEAKKFGRFAAYYLKHLRKENSDEAMWVSLVVDKLKIEEDFNPNTGAPKKGIVPGLDQLIAKKGEAKVFLYPVTAYSGTNASELFAETFAHYIIDGPGRIPEIVLDAFHRALPEIR